MERNAAAGLQCHATWVVAHLSETSFLYNFREEVTLSIFVSEYTPVCSAGLVFRGLIVTYIQMMCALRRNVECKRHDYQQ